MKIETILSDSADRIRIDNIMVYPFKKHAGPLKILRISEATFRQNPDQWGKEWVKALRELPAGSYTVVIPHRDGNTVVDVRLGKRGGLRVKPYDGKTINDPQQRPCLRIEMTS